MKLLKRPFETTEKIQIGQAIINGKTEYTTAIIHAPAFTEKESIWHVLQYGFKPVILTIGKKIDRVEFADVVLEGLLPILADSEDIYECAVDFMRIKE